MGIENRQLSGGQRVQLASWDDLRPTAHGADLQSRGWDRNASRTGLGFYDSTVHYMRNDWARANMDVMATTLGDKSVLLYRNRASDTWHTAEALDIDHVRPWKQHLTDKGTRSQADAHMAYNDVGNLRALPTAINRGRTAADRALEGGTDSQAWQTWSRKHFHFDPEAAHPAFNPATDGARRTTTRAQSWTLEDGRSQLSFDTRVEGKWFENQLSRQYRGTVTIDGDGEYSRAVPLFECPVTRQLVTRDAFDIDHVRPFDDVARAELDRRGGSMTKAEALDLYNDTTNLRLVSRAANCSHEWELDINGEFIDRGDREHEEPEDDLDRAFVEAGPPTAEDDRALQELRELLNPRPQPQAMDEEEDERPVIEVQPRYALGNVRNPDTPLYQALHGQVTAHNARESLGLNATETGNIAAALTLAVRNQGWDNANGVLYNAQRQTFYAYTGQPDAMLHTEVGLQAGRAQAAADSGRQLHELQQTRQQAQPAADVQAMDVTPQHGKPLTL
ncbi:hypothetical protein J5226_17715 [Lysobacter sp. K5869]|uniref:GH-E family nuclease n=1 Tax=Lysobacter sp. K5869 TaxID=2820808 RepID=UPI001C05F6DC|nr:GH-E family nuclease [Lysobacter sp. K5869]QWP75440.1 hypothetical protein J5226_17715 [Lysobacter sp. K5869]